MFDIAVLGGSFAGLSAVSQLARASRSVVLIDAGDVTHPMSNINFALANGTQAGSACHASRLFPNSITLPEIAA